MTTTKKSAAVLETYIAAGICRDYKGKLLEIHTGITVDARLASVPWVLVVDEGAGNRYVAGHHQTYSSAADAMRRWIEGSA